MFMQIKIIFNFNDLYNEDQIALGNLYFWNWYSLT